jgi:hypothetical protein
VTCASNTHTRRAWLGSLREVVVVREYPKGTGFGLAALSRNRPQCSLVQGVAPKLGLPQLRKKGGVHILAMSLAAKFDEVSGHRDSFLRQDSIANLNP